MMKLITFLGCDGYAHDAEAIDNCMGATLDFLIRLKGRSPTSRQLQGICPSVNYMSNLLTPSLKPYLVFFFFSLAYFEVIRMF